MFRWALRDEVEVVVAVGRDDRLDRRAAGIADRSRRQALVAIRVVRIVLVVELRAMQAVTTRRLALLRARLVPRDAGRGLLLGDETAVADRRIGLEALGIEVGLAEPVDEHARDLRALALRDGFLLDDRGHRQDLAITPPHLVLELGGVLRVLR